MSFLERKVATLGYSVGDRDLMTKAGTAIGNGHRYAVKASLINSYPNNTPEARADAHRAQAAWHGSLDELHRADKQGHFQDISGLHPGLRAPDRTGTQNRDRDNRRVTGSGLRDRLTDARSSRDRAHSGHDPR